MLLLRIFLINNKKSKLNTKNWPTAVGLRKRGSSMLNRLKMKCAGNESLSLLLTKTSLKMCTNRKDKRSRANVSTKSRTDGMSTSNSNWPLTSGVDSFFWSMKWATMTLRNEKAVDDTRSNHSMVRKGRVPLCNLLLWDDDVRDINEIRIDVHDPRSPIEVTLTSDQLRNQADVGA